jgi:hypothetical protein
VRLVPPRQTLGATDVPFRGRSLLGVLYFLSQAVAVPAEHEAAGWVTVTRRPDGARFDWSGVLGKIFRVHSGPQPPPHAAVRVEHRGAWFWIADDDLTSKTTLNLVTLLFTMKSSGSGGPTPLLAISN